jgi:hypothetical protein
LVIANEFNDSELKTDNTQYFCPMFRHVFTIAFSLFALLHLSSCKDDKEKIALSFILKEISVTEGNQRNTQFITVEANRPVDDDELITYEIASGTATGLDDIITIAGQPLLFTANASRTQANLAIEIQGDTHAELMENFKVIIADARGVSISFEISLLDDDAILPGQILSDAEGFLTPATYPSMKLIWSDEFNAAQLNTSDWTYETGNGCDAGICGWGNNELQSYTNMADNCRLLDGRLVITARTTSGSYTSARIKTQEKKIFKYGRVDVRAKLPKGKGIWPAIWMLGTNITSVSWPQCGEIDVMELVGHQPAMVHGTVHYFDGVYKYSSSSSSLTTGDFSDQFHVFTLRWDFNTIEWYVDNQLFKTFTNTGASYPFNSPFFFILNVAVGGNWPGNPDATTEFPQSMTVDYIRVFQ